ncbi:MAG: hypothetical protein K2P12_04505, partial [Clostridia bacterium]|nr:hypothetical protein [Clostridia bacterium]
MKYDDYEKVECNNYPNDNITIDLGKRYKKFRGIDKKKAFDTVYTAAIFGAAFAVIMLVSSIITLASSGTLAQTFMSMFGR